MFVARQRAASLPTSPLRAPKVSEDSFKELEQIIKYKSEKLRKELEYRVGVRTAGQVLGENKIEQIIYAEVDQDFILKLSDYYNASDYRRKHEGLLMPVYHSPELEALVSDKQDHELLQKLKNYYLGSSRKAKPFYLIHLRHTEGQDATVSGELIRALTEESAIFRFADRFFEAQARTKTKSADPALVDMVGTDEDESAAKLYVYLVKVRNILANHPQNEPIFHWLAELTGAVGFRRQREIFEASKTLLSGLKDLDDESRRHILIEADKRTKIPTNDTVLKTLELCMKLRAKMIRYCASKFEKYDSTGKDRVKQLFKNVASRGREHKLHAVETLIDNLDKKIIRLTNGFDVERDEIIELMSLLDLNGSDLPGELDDIIRDDAKKPEPLIVQAPVPAPSPNAGVMISIPHPHIKPGQTQKPSKLWDFSLADFTADKCKQSVRTIIEYYGGCSMGSEVDDMMNLIPDSDLRELPERLNKVAINKQVNVCQVLEELNPSDRRDSRLCFLLGEEQKNDNALTSVIRTMWGKSLLCQYETTLDKIMIIYEALPDKKHANDLVLSALSQMVPLVQRGFNDEFADSIEDYLHDLELDVTDFRGNTISTRLFGERIQPLPKLKEFSMFQEQAKTLLSSVPQAVVEKFEAKRRSMHFFN